MLVDPRRMKGLGIAVAAAVAVGPPATALGAESPGPRVIRIDAATGAQTVLAGGAPWTSLAAIAVAPSGTVYVANQGPAGKSGTPRGAGLYSLTAPSFAITPLKTTSPVVAPRSLVASGSTLYAADRAGLLGIDTNPPFTQTVVSPGGDTGDLALFGSTAYATYGVDCSTEGHDAGVVAIDLGTGSRRNVGDLGCASPAGIVAAPNGTLLIALRHVNELFADIVRLNPVTGTISEVAKGGKLHAPSDIALTASGDLVVADATSGVLRISAETGKQTTIASGGNVTQASSVALDASGNIYVAASGAAAVKATVKGRQRYSSSGLRVTAACRPSCTVAYRVTYPDAIAVGSSWRFADLRDANRAVRLKLDAQTKRFLAKTLRRKRSLKVTVTLLPVDAGGQPLGKEVHLTTVLVR